MEQRNTWLALTAMGLAMLVIGLDVTVFNVALPVIAADLDASTSQLQWIVNAYVLAMAGAILPMGPVLQYATEQPDAPYDVRIYPGADGDFTLYEDDNETYAYEKGQRATYDLVWNDRARTLTIGARQGRFPGMVTSRSLRITVAGADGQGRAGGPVERIVTYAGRPLTVSAL